MANRGSTMTLAVTSVLIVTASLSVSPLQGQTEEPSGLQFSGDMRLRWELTARQEPGPLPEILDPRRRQVVRFRAGVTKKLNDLLLFGARMATGSRDDPNTADVTIGAFVDDLEVGLDRLYLEFTYQGLSVSGGKFPNPFLTAVDLVWDGDVNPQGVTGSYTFSGSEWIAPKLTAIYSIVDEQTINPDSYMWGTQLVLPVHPSRDWDVTLAGGYLDYTIRSLINADAGDTRSNNLNADSTGYLSDFDLLNALAIVEYRPEGGRFPVRLVGNFVKNLGAADSDDQGFSLDGYVGKVWAKNHVRFQYGFSKLETDAVLAAFSHDNTTLATNYEQHTLAADYFPFDDIQLNVTWYYYRRDSLEPGPETASNPFISRLRLNAQVRF